MQLSIRLKAVAELAKEAKVLADIGTDHAYIPIYLALHGELKRAIAMDINKGPLERAEENVRKYGLEKQIELRLSDGAAKLNPKEADTIVIAGMGGALTIRILTEGREVFQNADHLILQPQSEIDLVRKFLHREGYLITEENMVKDDGKYYPMMKAEKNHGEEWEEYEYCFGRFLIRQKSPVLQEYLEKEEKKYEDVLKKLEGKTTDAAKIGRERAEGELGTIRLALKAME